VVWCIRRKKKRGASGKLRRRALVNCSDGHSGKKCMNGINAVEDKEQRKKIDRNCFVLLDSSFWVLGGGLGTSQGLTSPT
jgi:hypothetical protein